MQKDFHHAVTYVLSRMTGFNHDEADKIAYAAQYVDDANNSGVIQFRSGEMYNRISSAHGTYDIHNHMDKFENHLVWVPFHFLPGNNGKDTNDNQDNTFINKLVCRPDSLVARKMLDRCIKDSGKSYALHRLGITMHVYADTYAHQGFAGLIHEVNEVYDLKLENEELSFVDEKKSELLTKRFPMGHGAALECPDKPYLKWSYKNGLGEEIQRDNTKEFMIAVSTLLGELSRYRYDNGLELLAPKDEDIAMIEQNFNNFTSPIGDERHKKWIASIAKGDFDFGAQELQYIPKGEGSWKYDAIKQKEWFDKLDDKFEYRDTFLTSDWKLFHDALQEHRLTIIHDVLPEFGVIGGVKIGS